MIEKIKNILWSVNGIDGWKMEERIIESKELFFIKKELDMNRAKDVHHIKVTVYKDFEEDGKKYRGSSTTSIHPTMIEEEIKEAINSALYGASFVKNEYYPLVKPKVEIQPIMENKFTKSSLSSWMPMLTDEIFRSDNYTNGWINSAELFLNKIYTRILNSEGLEVSYETYRGELEFITNWKEKEEEVELYKDLIFSNYDEELITKSVDEMLTMSRDKAIAKPTPVLKDVEVILSGEPVKEFFSYYYDQAGAHSVYEQFSIAKLDKSIQGDNVKGDKVNMYLDPYLENSTQSAPYDSDGLRLKKVSLYEDGILKRYWGNTRYSHYLGIEPTGSIRNIIVDGGSKEVEKLKIGKYLEIKVFSDFQMDTLTGDFAGEIRLGWYSDGENVIPVTGGSISGNINEVHKEMYLSKELQKTNNFKGPESIKLLNVSIAGVE
ncbi:MAG: TldD/PmbA family protein [Gottschalkiaceae bacterium]|nr:MAG: TldD/PmbA family protein [Gottschalkiaceae bacterium]